MTDDPRAELQQLVLRLCVMSQIPSAPVGRSSHSSEESIGGRSPGEPSGLRRMEDYQTGFALKSPEYFQREAARASSRRLDELVVEARAAVEAWRRMPIPAGQPPTIDDPQWKRWVAESELSVKEIVRLFDVSRQYVSKVRKDYRDAA